MVGKGKKTTALLSAYYVPGTVLSALHMLSIKVKSQGRFWETKVVGSEQYLLKIYLTAAGLTEVSSRAGAAGIPQRAHMFVQREQKSKGRGTTRGPHKGQGDREEETKAC